MKKVIHFFIFFLVASRVFAYNDVASLTKAVRAAKPGDTLVLDNGIYKDAQIVFVGKGAAGKPIVIKAQTPGKVRLTGNSFLKIGGEYLEVNGFHFTDGYTKDAPVIDFRENNAL